MKTRPLTTMLTTACLLAVLALNIATVGTAVAQSPPKAEPVMTEELMSRLIKRTLASKKEFVMDLKGASILGLSESEQDRMAKQIGEEGPEGKHMFMLLTKEGSNDIIIVFKTKTTSALYLTDKTGILRKAAIATASGVSRITNEQAAEKYKAELKHLAALAADLPPTESAVPDKK